MPLDEYPAAPAVALDGVRPAAGQPGGAEPVLIDLGMDRGEPDDEVRPGRRTARSGWAPVLVALFVLVASGASAAPPAPPLAQLLSVRVASGDSYALTDDGLLLLQMRSTGTLQAYDLGTGRLRWQATADAPTYGVRTGGGSVLLRPRSVGPIDPGTVALASGTGAARWRRTGSITTVAGAPVLLAVNRVRSVAGMGGRISGQVDGVDPETGRTRWTVPVPSTAVLLGLPPAAGARPRMLLVHDSGVAREHDLTTGHPLAEVDLPPADYAPDNPAFFDGVLILRHPTPSGSVVSAYDPGTLRLRWSRPAGSTYRLQACGRLACLIGRSGVRAVEPADGTERWDRPGWRSVEQNGGVALAYASQADDIDLVGVIDAGTGTVTVPLPRWRAVPVSGTGTAGGGGNRYRVLVTRTSTVPGLTTVAVADPETDRFRLLGDLPVGVGDCRTLLSRLVCRSAGGELIVWAYR